MEKTKPDILAYIKYEPGEPADYATDELPMAVLTSVDNNHKKRRKKMKKNKLTKVEKLFAENALPGLFHIEYYTGRQKLRDFMRSTAYSIAGCLVGHMFTGYKSGHLVSASIIPDQIGPGRILTKGVSSEEIDLNSPEPYRSLAGNKILLTTLAGRGAELRVMASENNREILDDNYLCDFGEEEGTAAYQSIQIANIMAGKKVDDMSMFDIYPPAMEILKQAESWTNEMLDMPEVWSGVERLSKRLLEKGVISKSEEIETLCGEVPFVSIELPEWRERLFLGYYQK